MNSSPSKSSSIVRLFELYRKIPSYLGVGISTKDLHQYLTNEGFEVSKRTVERDLLKLSEVAGIYSERNIDGNVWKNSASNLDLLPTMQPSEALLLLTAERYLRRILPPNFQSMLNERINKAEKTLSRSNRLGDWNGKIYIVEGQLPCINHSVSVDIITAIYDAVLHETQIKILYLKADAEFEKEYQLNPLAIIVREHDHYLVATKDSSKNTPQLFKFTRMKLVTPTYKPIEKPTEFSLEKYIASNPTGWLISKEIEQIQLKVTGFAYDWLLHNQFDSSQKLVALDDGWFMVIFDAHVTYDLVGWILRFSTDVIAVNPPSLIDELQERVALLQTFYNK